MANVQFQATLMKVTLTECELKLVTEFSAWLKTTCVKYFEDNSDAPSVRRVWHVPTEKDVTIKVQLDDNDNKGDNFKVLQCATIGATQWYTIKIEEGKLKELTGGNNAQNDFKIIAIAMEQE